MRTRERLRHHYEVEKRLAARLHGAATREERTAIFDTMYDELFREVPDHPRLTERDSPEARQRAVRWQMGILRPYLTPSTHYLEFAPGGCALAWEVARHVARATGVDISDQSGKKAAPRTTSSWSSTTATRSICRTPASTSRTPISSSSTCTPTMRAHTSRW